MIKTLPRECSRSRDTTVFFQSSIRSCTGATSSSLIALDTAHCTRANTLHHSHLGLCYPSNLPFEYPPRVSIHSFIHFWHATLWVHSATAPDADIILQSGRFWATSIASFRDRFTDFRSCWVVFIHVVRGRPDDLLQFAKGKLLKSAWHLIRLTFVQCGRTGRDAVLEQ